MAVDPAALARTARLDTLQEHDLVPFLFHVPPDHRASVVARVTRVSDAAALAAVARLGVAGVAAAVKLSLGQLGGVVDAAADALTAVGTAAVSAAGSAVAAGAEGAAESASARGAQRSAIRSALQLLRAVGNGLALTHPAVVRAMPVCSATYRQVASAGLTLAGLVVVAGAASRGLHGRVAAAPGGGAAAWVNTLRQAMDRLTAANTAWLNAVTALTLAHCACGAGASGGGGTCVCEERAFVDAARAQCEDLGQLYAAQEAEEDMAAAAERGRAQARARELDEARARGRARTDSGVGLAARAAATFRALAWSGVGRGSRGPPDAYNALVSATSGGDDTGDDGDDEDDSDDGGATPAAVGFDAFVNES